MIFVTVGSQLPFDRLVASVDSWLADRPGVECCAQIGASRLAPRHMRYQAFYPHEALVDVMHAAHLIVAHAGMGSIISALQIGRPILIMPRHSARGETRNDHQVGSAEAFRRRPNVYVAMDEGELHSQLERLREPPAFVGDALGPFAAPPLLENLRRFLDG